MRALLKELDMVAEHLAIAALNLRANAPWTSDMMFMSSTCFLTSGMIKTITSDIDNINSIEDLCVCMEGCQWSYWDGYGSGPWEAVQAAKIKLQEMINARHTETLAKQQRGRDKKREEQEWEEQQKDEEETRERLATIGLDKVKHVTLIVSRNTPHTAGPSLSIPEPRTASSSSSKVLITSSDLNIQHSKVLQLIDTSMPPKLFYATTSSRKRKSPSTTSQISTSLKRSKVCVDISYYWS